MLIIPAIDLKDGHCVRLKQGLMEESTVFSEDPGAMARHWVDLGGKRLHLVDLNGAFAGKPVNEGAIKSIVSAVGGDIPIQLGGGIRDLDTIERYLDSGIDYVIIGTAAVKTPGFLHEACYAFPGQIMVALAQALTIPVIASGGVTNLEDVKKLCAVASEGIIGTITGRAIYEGTLDFAAAQKLADELSA
jgi:phosphoribosylformimino-5-aminoimidazole carboxamide ribonucleotide (ProFAR) isomerase